MNHPSDKPKDTVLILGAGPAGLACAYRLLKNNPSGKRVVIADSARHVGGAGGSFQWKKHTLDFGPHAFHTRGDEPEQLVRELFTGRESDMVVGHKQVNVYLKGKRFKYPLQVSEALLKFNPFLSLRILVEFALTSIVHGIVSIPTENFENWGRKRFGATLYKISFGDYTEKVWKTKATAISAKFASEKIQGFSFINLIRKLLRIGGQVTEPYYQTWIYHRYGSGKLYELLGQRVREMGGEILLGVGASQVHAQQERVTAVTLTDSQGHAQEVACDWLVNTIPLPRFVSLFGSGLPFTIRHSSRRLRYISLVLVYLEFDTDRISENHWFYLLDPVFRFNRVTEQKNLSTDTIERGKTVLSFELTCRKGDALWNADDEALVRMAKEDCEKISFVSSLIGKISDAKVVRVADAYEIYSKGFDQHADHVMAYLREYRNVLSVGRRGLFLQGDMHQAIGMGLEAGSLLAESALPEDALDAFYDRHMKYVDRY